MSGLCGWFGAASGADHQAIIKRMAEALPQYGRLQASEISGVDFGLAMRVAPTTGAFLAEPGLVAAIEGYPEWSDPAVARIARDAGHAAALVAAYRDKGFDLLGAVRGAFSIALLDLSGRSALLAIDRLGIQGLCYAEPKPGAIVFGSVTDAVRRHPHVGATIAPQSIFNFLFFVDRLPAPETIYREQRKLAPGECLVCESGRIEIKRYWQMPYRANAEVTKEAASEELRRSLRDAVAADLAGENPDQVGAFLSGGLDSSSVVGYASQLLPCRLQTFTIGFPVEGFDETYYADLAARKFDTLHRNYLIRPDDVLDVLQKSVQIYDEPFANSSMIPAYHCARLARESGVAMMLAGDGGDEIFAGNERYAKDQVFDYYGRLPAPLRHMLGWCADWPLPRLGPIGRALRYVEQARRTVPERMMGNLFQELAPEAVFAADALSAIDQRATDALMASIYDGPKDADKVQRMMNFDLRVTLADSDLRKVNRMCEAAGVRVRYPFLNDALVEFSAGLPTAMLMTGGRLRQFYKDAMSGFLPDEIINKQKHGFGLPYLSFMNSFEPLRSLVCDGLANLRQRGYFRADFLDALLERARRGALSSGDGVVWDLVVLELWLESRT